MDAFIYPELFYGNIGNSSSLTNQNRNEIASSSNKSHKTNNNSAKTKQTQNALINENNNKTSSSLSTTSTTTTATTSSLTASSTPSSETQEQIAKLSNHNHLTGTSDSISNKRYRITSRIKPLTSIEAQKLTSQLIKYNYGLGSKPFKLTNSNQKSQRIQSDSENSKSLNKAHLDSFLPELESPTGLLFDSNEMKFRYPSKEPSEISKTLQQQQQQHNQESTGTMVTHAVLIDLNRQSIETLMPKLTDKLRKKHYHRYLLNKKNMHRQNKASSNLPSVANDTNLLTASNSNLDGHYGHQDSSRRSKNSLNNLEMNLEGSKMSIKSCEENTLRKTSHLKEAVSSKSSFRLKDSIDDSSFDTTTVISNSQAKGSYRTEFRLKPLQLQQLAKIQQQENNFSDANCTSTNSFVLRNDEESKLTNHSKQSNSQKPTMTINSKTKLNKLVRLEFEDVNANKPKEATLTKPRRRLSTDLNETTVQSLANDQFSNLSTSRQSQQFYQRQYFKSKQRNYSGVNNKLDFSEFLDDETSNDVTTKSIELFEKDSLQSDFNNYYDLSLRVESPHKLTKSMPDDYKHYSHSSVHVFDLQQKKGRAATNQISYENYSKRKNQHLIDLFQSDNYDIRT